VQDQELKEAQ